MSCIRKIMSIIIEKGANIANKLTMQMKLAIERYVAEKDRQEHEKALIERERHIRHIETHCRKEFLEVLQDMPSEYNIKTSLSSVSIPVDYVEGGFGIYQVKIPKMDYTKALRPAQRIALQDELNARIKFLKGEAQIMMDEFLRQNEEKYNLLCENAYYSGDDRELLEFQQKYYDRARQMYSSIHYRFWSYDVELVEDESDSLYITLRCSLGVPEEWL